MNCGYTKQIKIENKESIICGIVLHSTTRLIPILQQIRKGMELYGLVKQIAANREICHSLFVPGTITKFLQDFLEELEISDGETESLSVQHVLQWMTGQAHVPILPEKRAFKIICQFTHDCNERLGEHGICYPVVSACTCTVTFPVRHLSTYQEFRKCMSEAVMYGGEFQTLVFQGFHDVICSWLILTFIQNIVPEFVYSFGFKSIQQFFLPSVCQVGIVNPLKYPFHKKVT